MSDLKSGSVDPFVSNYHASELKIAAEFLTNWLPFLTRDLCPGCSGILTNRVRSLDPGASDDLESSENNLEPSEHKLEPPENVGDDNNPGPVEDGPDSPQSHGTCDTNSIGSWKDTVNESYENANHISTASDPTYDSPATRLSWADMAQEDEHEEGGGGGSLSRTWADDCEIAGEKETSNQKKPSLPRDQREHIRFMNVQRKKDFICLERVKGKIVNILDGLELHTGVFSAAEQKRIVDFVYDLQEKGKNGELKERTYSEPQKWMRGKGRVTIQFGCCYNYAVDKNGNPPGILQHEVVDPLPHLFKVIIRRLVSWHVLPPSCVPDSCIVNIYEPGDCIPPHIDHRDFVRPFCTVSFLSECNILFGSDLRIAGPGEFSGSTAIPLPVGSVLVLKGNGADVAKHCVPAVPTKRISITFRKMDGSKRPSGFVPEPDLQGLQPLSYNLDNKPKRWRPSKQLGNEKRGLVIERNWEGERRSMNKTTGLEPESSSRNGSQYSNKPRVRF
ncbi:RNA demethylase ALKBH9B isoform X2 [Aristolochia californica]|uniref:RNA demethylase ALKBH9B isoform X2 n=2 Tax=Aristolochia californica TaxID=171875 RepID=UPI0035D8357A